MTSTHPPGLFRPLHGVGLYFASLLRSHAWTKVYVVCVLAVAALLVLGVKRIGETRHLERVLQRRVSGGHHAKPEWYALIWEKKAGGVNAVLCLVLAACWPLVERRLPHQVNEA